jgi:hypothetical protein
MYKKISKREENKKFHWQNQNGEKNIIWNNNNKKLIDHSSMRWIKEFILLFSLTDPAVVQE